MEEARFRWVRWEKAHVEVTGEFVKLDMATSESPVSYEPFAFPNLADAFAKVDDAAGAVEFVRAYGELGYWRLCTDRRNRNLGEPLDWILTHAACVRLALGLIHALQAEDDRRLVALLDAAHYADYASPEEYRKVHPLNLSWRMLAYRDQVNASGHEYIGLYRIGVGATIELLPLYTMGIEDRSLPIVRRHAYQLLASMVNVNIQHVGRRLSFSRHGRQGLRPALFARSLLEAIWWHVGEAALLTEHERTQDDIIENGSVKVCEECGRPFISTHGKERFCPDPLGGPSKCASRNRQRRYRQRLREKQKEGS